MTPEPVAAGAVARGAAVERDILAKVAESWDFETLGDDGETSAENNSSAILLLVHDSRRVLLTGDAGIPALTEAVDRLDAIGFRWSDLNLIQVPHHGSKRNVGPTILDRILGLKLDKDETLRTAFVSAAPEGAPKHPAKKVLNAFRRRGAPVHTTQGSAKCHRHNAPVREGYSASIPLPFYDQVDE